jgi:hypothetical protein
MIRLATVVISTLLIGGCDRLTDLSRLIWGVEETVIVISPTPIKVSASPTRFELREPVKVVGSIAQLCFPLRADFPLGPTEVMNAEFKSLMREAQLTAVVTTTAGKAVTLEKVSQSWSKNGKVEKRDELSACVYEQQKGQALPVGTAISKVEVKATAPLDVRGVFWVSSNAWDQGKKGN